MHLCANVSKQIGYSDNFLTFRHPLICDMPKKLYRDKKHFLRNDTDERGSKIAILQSEVLFE